MAVSGRRIGRHPIRTRRRRHGEGNVWSQGAADRELHSWLREESVTVRMPIGRTAVRQAMRAFRYEALKFVSFPVQMLGKSSKMVHLCSEIKSILPSISHPKSNVFTFDSSKVQYCIIDLAFLSVCPDTDVCALEIAPSVSEVSFGRRDRSCATECFVPGLHAISSSLGAPPA